MPFIEDWITHPMTTISRIHDKSPSTFDDDVRNYFKSQIENPEAYREIPSLNDRVDELTSLPSGCLVRYRAMVQDMTDDEIYCSHYRIRSNDQQHVEIEKSAKYTDLFVCPPGYTVINEEPERERFSSRQCYTCIPIPNETQWVKEKYYRFFGEQMSMSKRSLDNNGDSDIQQLLTPLKRLKTNTDTKDDVSEISTSTDRTKANTKSTFIVKVYDITEEIHLNSMIEFVGIYYDQPIVKDPMETLEKDHDEGPSIKFIHCIHYKKLMHDNPLLYQQPTIETNDFLSTRQTIISLFECIFPNDPLLCEYILLHFLSRTYVRQPSLAYGKLSLNISHISDEQAATLEQVLQMILPLYSRLSITVNTLNTMQLMPNKNVIKDEDTDSNSNKLMQTPLQLPLNSHLLIDERQMECGQLTTLGLNNVKLLQDLLRQQTLKYEFHVYQMDYDCDIRCLVVSSTKSILPCDIYIRYEQPTDNNQSHTQIPNISKEQLDSIRRYLTYVGQILELDQTKTDESADINTQIQEDFVQMRKEKLLTNLDDFHLLLVLARLKTLSYGERILTKTYWEQAKTLEFTRRQRMNL